VLVVDGLVPPTGLITLTIAIDTVPLRS
jgi:hypothetical protein